MTSASSERFWIGSENIARAGALRDDSNSLRRPVDQGGQRSLFFRLRKEPDFAAPKPPKNGQQKSRASSPALFLVK